MLDKNDVKTISELLDDKLEPIKEQLDRVDKRSMRTGIIIENDIQKSLKVLYENRVDTIKLEKRLNELENMIKAIQ